MILTAEFVTTSTVKIFCDGEYLLTADCDFWLSYSYGGDVDMNNEELAAFIEAAGSRFAFNKAMNILSRRDYCAKELVKKLCEKNIERSYAQSAVEKLEEMGYINDEIYANRLAEQMYNSKGYSPKKIRYELVSKGISDEIAQNAVSLLDKDTVLRIIELLRTKYKKNLNDEKGVRRTFAALARAGYSYSDVRTAFNRAGAEFETEDYDV